MVPDLVPPVPPPPPPLPYPNSAAVRLAILARMIQSDVVCL